ncbi:hypothetical protein H0E87_013135 [Populus deltoides]|uniref:Uncharacterized protein n=1 Tax=Populus deltoides TaxID=3696 RepID=A0A8T2YMN0_POPDE|nr:hypothetical protein H0E87_013135 [Populus deltoides]KAH8506196.1 hypothetical protein H0E87_013135 [Populus deltoides]
MSSRSHAVGDVLVDELESNLSRFASLKDVEEETYTSDGDDNSDAEEGYESYGSQPVKKCHDNSSSMAPSDEEDNEPETGLQLLFPEEFPRLNSTRLPLVSAMKGSREKQGGSPRKLTVSWAPDVYDPIPNSLSHSVKSSKQKKSSRKDRDKDNNHNKKNGKKGQKGSSSKGLGGKDKKQFRKSGGRSDKCYKTMDAREDTDFGVGSPDYCGSSFLKNSVF